MSSYAKILSLAYNSAVATKDVALKSNYRSVRLIKDTGTINPEQPSYVTNVLLNGKCIDPESRCLYVFYIDTYYGSAWIIEINIDNRVQTIVYYDKYNAIGFDAKHKIHNPRVVHGRLVWTDDNKPVYQMDIARAKKSFALKIGYGQYPQTVEWDDTTPFGIDQIVSNGNKYYKSVVDGNTGHEPKDDSTGTYWTDLKCLIEDAYYSMNIENFYFAPIPPKMPPLVTYQSDDTRKINNLRQTLFQFAYRYVYMDWRKSTFSPASIVPLPQAEEEAATGLANEVVSLNNKLQIVVNTGGEEVRAIEIVGRSSADISSWYLIETINKFDEQERGGEISGTAETGKSSMLLNVLLASVLNESILDVAQREMALIIPPPGVIMSWVAASSTIVGWTAAEFGIAAVRMSTITCSNASAQVTAKPSWLTLHNPFGQEVEIGMSVNTGDIVSVFPKDANTGVARSGYVTFTNIGGDSISINCLQAAVYIPPVVPITPTIAIDPTDTSGMLLGTRGGLGNSGGNTVNVYFTVNHPTWISGNLFDIFWRVLVNGTPYGNGVMQDCIDEQPNNRTLTLTTNLAPTDTIVVYLSTEAYQIVGMAVINTFIAVQPPSVINSSVVLDTSVTGWIAAEYEVAEAHAVVVNCQPSSVQLTSLPAWLKIVNAAGYEIVAGMGINDGDTIRMFPRVENLGGQLGGTVVFTNSYGTTGGITVYHSAALAPPSNEPVDCFVYEDPLSPGLTVTTNYTQARSYVRTVMFNARVYTSSHASNESIAVHWRATINGAVQGYGDTTMRNNVFEIRTVVVNVDPLVGDTINIYLSHT